VVGFDPVLWRPVAISEPGLTLWLFTEVQA
jgi:hypothetical protein